jgi:hypothetical protein
LRLFLEQPNIEGFSSVVITLNMTDHPNIVVMDSWIREIKMLEKRPNAAESDANY